MKWEVPILKRRADHKTRFACLDMHTVVRQRHYILEASFVSSACIKLIIFISACLKKRVIGLDLLTIEYTIIIFQDIQNITKKNGLRKMFRYLRFDSPLPFWQKLRDASVWWWEAVGPRRLTRSSCAIRLRLPAPGRCLARTSCCS